MGQTTPGKLNPKPGPVEGEYIEVISWAPRVFLYHNFLNKEDADHVVELAGNKVQRSQVVAHGGGATVSSSRTSSGVFIMGEDREDVVIQKLEDKIAKWIQIPKENGEAFYLLRYQPGEEYKPHTDWFRDLAVGTGQRICTVILYLREPEEGGDTTFPSVGLTIAPKAGNALLFWDVTPERKEDSLSLHAGTPVIKGTKWVLTKWIREYKYN